MSCNSLVRIRHAAAVLLRTSASELWSTMALRGSNRSLASMALPGSLQSLAFQCFSRRSEKIALLAACSHA